MKFIKNMLRKRREQKAFTKKAIEYYSDHMKTLETQREELNTLMKSSVPYMKRIDGESENAVSIPDTPAHVRYEFNNAFIKQLKSEGYTGTDEYIIAEWERNQVSKNIDKIVDSQKEEIRKSAKPWVKMEGYAEEDYDSNSLQVRTEFDFNPAFVRMLRDNGYTGSSDDIVVYKWFKAVAEIIAIDIHGEKYDG